MLSPLTLATLLLGAPAAPAAFTPQDLWAAWPEARFVRTPAPCLRPEALGRELTALVARHAEAREQGLLALEQVGRSFEGRPIRLLTVGRGPKRVLLWSQMHGDEPSATPALLDLAHWLLSRRDEPQARALLEGATLLMVPMLNPDGAERYERRNAQGIDVNRDALNLATPEGRLLKTLRERYEPLLGFNLHDQNRRTGVGDTGRLASIALLAVAGDPQGTLTPGRARAKRVCSALLAALQPFIPGAVTRYDEDWSPRAFGDNLTKWGTPVVLIESGAPPPGGFEDLTRLNFVGLLSALHGLVRDDLAGHDPALYEGLLRNQDGGSADVVVRGGLLLQPASDTLFRADLAFDVRRSDRALAGCGADEPAPRSSLVEVGDARLLATRREVDAADRLLVAPFTVAIESADLRAWLDVAALESLARLGVGTLLAYVWPEDERVLAALEQAPPGAPRPRLLRRDARAGVARPMLRLERRPTTPASSDVQAFIAALGAASTLARVGHGLDPLALLGGLGALGEARFAPGRPASFLVLRPPADGPLTLERTRLEAIWLDGQEVPARPTH